MSAAPHDLPDVTAPFTDLLGVAYTELTPTRVVATLAVTDKLKQPYGIVHGGVYCTLAESVASVGAVIARGGQGAVGQSNQTDFLRATRGGVLTATATPVHVGRSVQLWGVDITDEEGHLCAQARVRLFNIPAEAVTKG
ncbi:MAG TPA: PaaI family thioesterase [Euzebya sp.]|nr:PaaI family thioesterase [Euzebya sp.]